MYKGMYKKIYLFIFVSSFQSRPTRFLATIKKKKERRSFKPFRSIREVGQSKAKKKKERYRQKGEEIIYNTVSGSSRFEIGHDDFRRSKTKRDRQGGGDLAVLCVHREMKRERGRENE